jgi:osmotically-inducible protein OsmY
MMSAAGPSQGANCSLSEGRRAAPREHKITIRLLRLLFILLIVCAAGPALVGCAAVAIGAAAGAGTLVAMDRRSGSVRAGDQAIESKVTKAAAERWNVSTGVHLNVTSFDGKVLLTGEVPTPAIRDEIGKIATSLDSVRSVTNELLVGPETLIAARTQDTYITSKVKARLIEAKKLDANNVKVVTERRVVYLMGLVSPTEGDAAADVAASTSDVVRVVKLFEYKG